MKSRKIRLLTFSTLFPSSIKPGHGIFVETRLRELISSGEVESRVVAPVPWFFSTHPRFGEYAQMARIPKRETRFGVDVQHPRYFLPPKIGMNVAPFMLALGALSSFQRLLDEGYDFDVIDSHYYYPDGVAAAILASFFSKPFTVTARGSDVNLITKYVAPLRLMRWASARAGASIGVSEALTSSMKKKGFFNSQFLTMPNGVDLNLFAIKPKDVVRTKLRWPQQPTILSVGNLVTNKGHHLVIEAMIQLPEFRLVVVGEGPERAALESLVLELELTPRVSFVGQIPQSELPDYFCAADALVLASSREGWPNVLLESLACGTPVVATPVGGIPEIVTTLSAGRIMNDQTVSEVVRCVKEVCNQRADQVAVRQTVERRSWQATTNAQVSLFSEIVKKYHERSNA